MVVDLKIVLVAPEIPGNTGAVGRLCVCLGTPLHLIKPLGFELTETRIRRAGLDYWQHLDLTVHDSWDRFCETEAPGRMVFASTHGKQDYFDFQFKPGDYLVFGNESSGLPPALYDEYAAHLYQIPMPGEHGRSHNLANAAAIVAYEAYRQMRVTGG